MLAGNNGIEEGKQKKIEKERSKRNKKGVLSDRESRETIKVASNQLVINLFYCQYPVVKKAARALNFKVSLEDIQIVPKTYIYDGKEYFERLQAHSHGLPDFDVCWIDNGIPADTLARIKPFQRIS